MRYPVRSHHAALAAIVITVCVLSLSTGCASFNQGDLHMSYDDPEHWSAEATEASVDFVDGDNTVTLDLDRVLVARRGSAYDTAIDLGVVKDGLDVDAGASLVATDIGGDATLSASVHPDEGRSVAIDTSASWASPVADELDGGLMAIKTCAAIGTADAPRTLCVGYEAGTMGGQDVACVSYGDGINLCFPLPDAWQRGDGGEQGAVDDPATDGAPADGGYPDATPLIDAASITPSNPDPVGGSQPVTIPRPVLADAG